MAAEAAISSLLELLGNQIIQKAEFVRGVEGEVELLKDELRRMQCFLEDANRKQVEDARVHNWISEIRELALDAEDTIQMFLLNTEKANRSGSLKRCTTFLKRMQVLDRIGGEIDSIRRSLTDIEESRKRYGISDPGVPLAGSTSRSHVERWRRLSPWGKDEHLVGVEDDVKELLRESIFNEKKGLSVAVLRGLGGIGKSTLAREIYNHPEVIDQGKFDCHAWVVVSSDFREAETLKQLILELQGADKEQLRDVVELIKDDTYLLQKLQQMLHRLLKGKSYFIVLDDVWEQRDWECLSSVFLDEKGILKHL